jgi:hypothetical protein
MAPPSAKFTLRRHAAPTDGGKTEFYPPYLLGAAIASVKQGLKLIAANADLLLQGVLTMAISISSAPPQVQAQTTVQPTAARRTATAPKPRAAAAPQPAVNDTVRISAAAQALQEVTENSAQTTKEASAGDVQAKNLLAREAAAHGHY